ncbi:hypothetical protein DQ04_05361020 [Trypanosoma grayi]|uniref:hypothetical protein n=1 Tax=Trypanosoma grayi TaxID=71804 RepID=UPI0004F4BBC3|nr:hypothetical protein DQ04_05361020 [Trypanosoma grayi]KEG09354.1 hypothetical protein DQ04_05361020 [Trypanosoma grayi]
MEGEVASLRWKEWLSSLHTLALKWREVHLNSLQDDAPYDRTLANHEGLKAGREKVRSMTKTFAQLDNDKKLNEFSTLLKEYQGYIDRLTLYFKDAERSYVMLFNQVKGMTDPYPLMEKLAGEMEKFAVIIKRAEMCDALEEEIRLLQAELKGLKNEEATIGRLRRQLDEVEKNAKLHAERSVRDATAEYQALLAQSRQQGYEAQQEIQSLRDEVFKKDLSIQNLRNRVEELCTSLEGVKAQRSRDVADLAVELEAAHNNLLQREAEVQRLLANESRDCWVHEDDTSEVGSSGAAAAAASLPPAPPPVAVLESPQVNGGCVDLATNSIENHDDEVRHRQAMEEAVAAWEEQRQRFIQREEALQNELAGLRKSHDEHLASSDARLRQKDEERHGESAKVQELQHRLRSLNAFVDQLKSEKERLARTVQTLEGELHRISKAAPIHENVAPHVERENPLRCAAQEGDEYGVEKLLLTTSAWKGGAKPLSEKEKIPSLLLSPQPSLRAEKDPFLIVEDQRERLREEILTLNEASSAQIQRLKLEVATLTKENSTLRQRLASCAGRDICRGGGGGGGGGSVLGISMLAEAAKDDGLQAKTAPRRFVDTTGGVLSRRTALNVLNYGARVCSMRVFSGALGGRLFVLYMGVLHIYLICSVLL